LEGLGLKSREKVVGEIRNLAHHSKNFKKGQKLQILSNSSFFFEKNGARAPLSRFSFAPGWRKAERCKILPSLTDPNGPKALKKRIPDEIVRLGQNGKEK